MPKLRHEDFTMFKKSTPWGYNPVEVEECITKYENVIQSLNAKITEQNQIRASLVSKIEKLEEELREMHLQMSSLEMPDIAEATSHYVLEEFKNGNLKQNQPINTPKTNNEKTDKVNKEYNEDGGNNSSSDSQNDLPFIIAK